MDISRLQINLAVLLMALVGLVFTAWLFRRFDTQSWYEKRLPWLFPKDLVVAAETMAREHPYRHMFLIFMFILGGFAISTDLGWIMGAPSLSMDPLIRYSIAAGVAVFSLYASRKNATRRAQARGGGGQDG